MASLSSKWKKNYSFLQQGLTLLRLTLNSMKPSLLLLPPKYGDFRYVPLCPILRLLGIESRLCICSAGTILKELHLQPQPMLKNKQTKKNFLNTVKLLLLTYGQYLTKVLQLACTGWFASLLPTLSLKMWCLGLNHLKVSQILAPKYKTLVNLESLRSDLQLPLYYTPGKSG